MCASNRERGKGEGTRTKNRKGHTFPSHGEVRDCVLDSSCLHAAPPIVANLLPATDHVAMQDPSTLEQHPGLARLLVDLNTRFLTPTGLGLEYERELHQVRLLSPLF